MRKKYADLSITPRQKRDYRHRSFVFPNKLFNDLETLRNELKPPPSLNRLVRKILEYYVKKTNK